MGEYRDDLSLSPPAEAEATKLLHDRALALLLRMLSMSRWLTDRGEASAHVARSPSDHVTGPTEPEPDVVRSRSRFPRAECPSPTAADGYLRLSSMAARLGRSWT